MKYGFGVDVGGTTVKIGLLNWDGELLEKREIPTHTENGGEKILPDIAACVNDILTARGIDRADVRQSQRRHGIDPFFIQLWA